MMQKFYYLTFELKYILAVHYGIRPLRLVDIFKLSNCLMRLIGRKIGIFCLWTLFSAILEMMVLSGILRCHTRSPYLFNEMIWPGLAWLSSWFVPKLIFFFLFFFLPMDRLFFGANKVMQVSLGRTASDEVRPGLYKVSKVNLFFHIAYSSSVLFLYSCRMSRPLFYFSAFAWK